jgi:hypothetical protein
LAWQISGLKRAKMARKKALVADDLRIVIEILWRYVSAQVRIEQSLNILTAFSQFTTPFTTTQPSY